MCSVSGVNENAAERFAEVVSVLARQAPDYDEILSVKKGEALLHRAFCKFSWNSGT